MKSYAYGFFGFFVFFLFGLWFVFHHTAEHNKVTITGEFKSLRDPAAIKKVYDFSNLEGADLDLAMKKRLVGDVRVVPGDREVGLELGQSVVRSEDGGKQFVCQKYSQVVMFFEGEGMAIGGESPKMEVEGQCEVSNDINRISAIWIPVQRIRGEPVADGEFDYRDGKPVKIRFANVSDEWPSSWRLKAVRLYDPSGANSEIYVDPKDMSSIVGGKVVVVDFK